MTAPPPSKSDRRISRIWLSSQWVLLREGAALRLVPKHPAQSFGANKVNCARLSPLVINSQSVKAVIVRKGIGNPHVVCCCAKASCSCGLRDDFNQ